MALTVTGLVKAKIQNTFSYTNDITILEGICGVGKSIRMIEHIKENPDERYLIVLPLLDEVDRYQEELPGLNFKEPLDESSTKTEHYSGPQCQDSFFKNLRVDFGWIIRTIFPQFLNAVFNLHFLIFDDCQLEILINFDTIPHAS